MSTTQVTIPSPPEGQDLATVPTRFEVTPLPAADFDRAKAFYSRLGWRLDVDLQFTEQVRAVQFTPPGSAASIQFAPAGPAPLRRLLLAVEDIEAARAELAGRGVEVSDVQQFDWGSFVFFNDPDGNGWAVQQIPERA